MSKVGHIVPEFSADRLRNLHGNEICVGPWIYQITRKGFVQGLLDWAQMHENTGEVVPATWARMCANADEQYDKLKPLLSQKIMDTGGSEIFAPLNKLAHLIVGAKPRVSTMFFKESMDVMPSMTAEELARYNQLRAWPTLDERQGGLLDDPEQKWERQRNELPREVYVSINGFVYDVTSKYLAFPD